VFGYVDPGGIMVAVPSQDALPSSAEIYSLMSRARQGEGPVTSEAPRVDDDEPFHWVAIAVPYSDTVVLTGAPATATVEHRRLDVVLALTVIALCIVGTGLGHVLSGLAMRPAIRSIEQHEQFLREAAHELRTPLAVMRLALDSNDEGGQSETLSAQLGRMSSLVGRLLDRARIRSADPSSFQLGPVRLDQVVEVAVEELDGADLVLLDLDQTVVVGHADLLAQAVRNLVENALHHGAGPVEIELHGGVLEVSDSGSGIPMSKRREVLQGGRTTAAGTGTGTGLAIVDWVAEIHHARLSLRDAVPHGLRVQLTFPMSHIRGSR
jgi:two-component system OmpR family sensor kinase